MSLFAAPAISGFSTGLAIASTIKPKAPLLGGLLSGALGCRLLNSADRRDAA
jgi:hypothetical protein